MGFADKSPAWAYTKSKGFYAGIALDGTIVIERNDENARFYGQRVKAGELIKGGARRPPSADGLIATIEMAEGRQVREHMIPTGPPPSELVASAEPPTPSLPPPLPSRPSTSSQRTPASSSWVPSANPTPTISSPTSDVTPSTRGSSELPSLAMSSTPSHDIKSDPSYSDDPPAYA